MYQMMLWDAEVLRLEELVCELKLDEVLCGTDTVKGENTR